ncbi:hypothetical protein [Massilia brevitalea]|uniref:hypothetical protein n=1 Tax=Massilia brevitalea TaxID=442526 RepID=UPI00273923A4|nr:hypothetical protein [Massilia brevitalea]
MENDNEAAAGAARNGGPAQEVANDGTAVPAMAAAAAPAAAAGDQGSGLASVQQIVELADQLSACADQLHDRIMRDIRAYQGRTVPDALQAAARALLEDEVILRQRANGLYADAATYIVKSLGKSQRGVIALTTEAAEKIRKITLIGDITGLVGGLLQLAGAAATGQAASIVGALDKIRAHMAAIEANKAPAPPAKPA